MPLEVPAAALGPASYWKFTVTGVPLVVPLNVSDCVPAVLASKVRPVGSEPAVLPAPGPETITVPAKPLNGVTCTETLVLLESKTRIVPPLAGALIENGGEMLSDSGAVALYVPPAPTVDTTNCVPLDVAATAVALAS